MTVLEEIALVVRQWVAWRARRRRSKYGTEMSLRQIDRASKSAFEAGTMRRLW